MAYSSTQVSVATTGSTLLFQTSTGVPPDPKPTIAGGPAQTFQAGSVNDPVAITIQNLDAANPIYIGGVGVTAASGTRLAPQASANFVVVGNQSQYAVATGAAVTVAVLVGATSGIGGGGAGGGGVAGVVPNVQSFTTPGSYTWTKPAGVTMVQVTCQGGGGGGGSGAGAALGVAANGGGGGASGCLSTLTFLATDLPSTLGVTVGAGGGGGAAQSGAGVGGAAGSNSFLGTAPSLITATGG